MQNYNIKRIAPEQIVSVSDPDLLIKIITLKHIYARGRATLYKDFTSLRKAER